MCLKKLRGLFLPQRSVEQPSVEQPRRPRNINLRPWLRERLFSAVNTSRGGPDMPKYQSCPQCHSGSKRRDKTITGAFYGCRNHGRFLVTGYSQ